MSALFGSMRKSRSSASAVSAPSGTRLSQVPGEIDVYFLKQLAKEAKEYDVEQKIDLEIKMQEGTRKLLQACRHPLQALEAAKSLLTSSERVAAYHLELQRRKNLKHTRISQSILLPSQGKVAISDIRMPLIWKDSDHFKNRGDGRRFAVFCLLKVGTEVHDTTMISDVDRNMTDIAFDDVILFNSVPPNFEFRLEVYSHVLQEDMSIATASSKLRKKISHSVSRAIGKRLSDSFKEDLSYKNGYSDFDMVAHASLGLQDADSRIKTYDLQTTDRSGQHIPLFGHFCCRMAVQPKCVVHEAHSGYLSLVQQIGNITGLRRMLCSLKDFSLSMWANFADVHNSNPDIVIPIKTGIQVTPSAKSVTYPRFSFTIRYPLQEEGEAKELLLAADSPVQLSEWISSIKQLIDDYEQWKPASENPMDIPSPLGGRNSQFGRHRNSSLYDETPYCEDGAENQKRDTRVSTPPFCSWSSSSSSTNSSLEHSQSACRKSVSAYFPSFFHG